MSSIIIPFLSLSTRSRPSLPRLVDNKNWGTRVARGSVSVINNDVAAVPSCFHSAQLARVRASRPFCVHNRKPSHLDAHSDSFFQLFGVGKDLEVVLAGFRPMGLFIAVCISILRVFGVNEDTNANVKPFVEEGVVGVGHHCSNSVTTSVVTFVVVSKYKDIFVFIETFSVEL